LFTSAVSHLSVYKHCTWLGYTLSNFFFYPVSLDRNVNSVTKQVKIVELKRSKVKLTKIH